MSVSTYVPDSTKILHTAYADFVTRQIGRTVHVVQYDNGLPILAVKLFSDGQPYTIPANADINIKLGKSDGKFVYNPALGCDSARHIAYFEVTYQMVVLAEEVSPVVEVLVGDAVSASSSISIIIDRNPVQKDAIESTSEWKTIHQAIEYSKEAINAAAKASADRSAAATSASNAGISENKAKTSETNAAQSELAARVSETNAAKSELAAGSSERNAAVSEHVARTKASESEVYSIVSKSYAVGNTGYRTEEDVDNAKYYAKVSSDAMYSAKTSEYNSDIYSLLSKSYAVGNSLAVLGDDSGNEIVTSEGCAIEFFSRQGEDTDNAKYYAEQAAIFASNAEISEDNAKTSETKAADSASSIFGIEERVSDYAKIAKSYAVGDTDYRQNENIDNARYYYQEVKRISQALAGTLILGIKGDAETDYRDGYVNITAENIGVYDKAAVDLMLALLMAKLEELEELSAYSYFVDSGNNNLLTNDEKKIILTN